MNYLLIDSPVHIYSSACFKIKTWVDFCIGLNKKQPNVPAIQEAAVLGLHRTIILGQLYLLQQRRPDSNIKQTDAKTRSMEAIICYLSILFLM